MQIPDNYYDNRLIITDDTQLVTDSMIEVGKPLTGQQRRAKLIKKNKERGFDGAILRAATLEELENLDSLDKFLAIERRVVTDKAAKAGKGQSPTPTTDSDSEQSDSDSEQGEQSEQQSEFDLAAELQDLLDRAGLGKLAERQSPTTPQPRDKCTHPKLFTVLQTLAAGEHAFLVGPAGSGKSTIAMQAADALGVPLQSISLGPTTPTSKLFGFMDAAGTFRDTPFYKAYVEGGLMLIDELDNGHPGLVAELNQALANGHAAFANGMAQRHPQFRLIATGNTFGRGASREFVGRNVLDAATLDRFTTIEIPIDEKLERDIALQGVPRIMQPQVKEWVRKVQKLRKRAEERGLHVIISPRASIGGAKLLVQGMSIDEVTEIRLLAGLKQAERDKLLTDKKEGDK